MSQEVNVFNKIFLHKIKLCVLESHTQRPVLAAYIIMLAFVVVSRSFTCATNNKGVKYRFVRESSAIVDSLF